MQNLNSLWIWIYTINNLWICTYNAGFYYVALALWWIADYHVLGQHHPFALLCPELSYDHQPFCQL
jgi:hypothetical protein